MIDIHQYNLVYVTRDIERAIGLEVTTPGYFIISNSTPFAKSIAEGHDNVLLIEEDSILDTWELLSHPKTDAFLGLLGSPEIIVFKNTPKIERICEGQGWTLLNPKAKLSNTIEEKISQVEWLGELSKHLPEHSVTTLKEVTWSNTPFILQFNRAHTGTGTILISSESQLQKLQEQFPDRPVRVTAFIDAKTYTVNVALDAEGNTVTGNISYQITGLSPFTNRTYATVGNDWKHGSELSNKIQKQIETIIKDVTDKLHTENWRGLCGFDFLIHSEKVYLLEINARQPASTTFESQLQTDNTIFEAHILGLLGESLKDFNITTLSDGAQVIFRNQKDLPIVIADILGALEPLDLRVTPYENSKEESDLLRIQTTSNFITSENTPNELLLSVARVLNPSQGNIKTVSTQTQNLIESFKKISVGGKHIPCPYFNNKKTALRAALKVNVGKGSVQEIEEEVEIIALKEKVDLTKLSEKDLTKFVVEHNLGIDCSGFVYYLLTSEKQSLKISFPRAGLLRSIIRKFRTIENINVQVLAHEKNSAVIELSDVQPGDIITMLKSGPKSDRDHILYVDSVEYKDDQPATINYVHSLQWSTDGKYNHGVRNGSIEIKDPTKPLIEQIWTEQDTTGEKNETFTRAKHSSQLSIKRVK